MEKTTVYLTPEQKAALAAAARDEGRSEARLIRAGIDEVIARHRAGGRASDDPEPANVVPAKPRFLDREAFVRLLAPHQADAGLTDELRVLVPETTDDEPLP